MRKFSAAALVLIAPLAAMIASPAAAETLDELYAKAKSEGALAIYGGGPQRIYEDWIKAFDARFPGITVKLTGGYAGGLAPMIDKQIAAKKLEVDFVTFQAVQEFLRWKSDGVLLPFKMEGYDELDPTFRDPDGAYTPINVFAIAPAYNTKLVTAQDIPKSALDFLKPIFHGRLITAYPQDDDATMFAFNTIVKKYGWKFMEDYMATQPKLIQGHLGVVRSVVSGESLATFDMMVHHTMEERSQGHPVDVAFPTEDPMPIWGQLGAIFKDSPHPNAAKLYLQWYMAKEQQSHIGTWSARRDVPPPFGLKPIFDYKVANDFNDIVTDPKVLADLRSRYAGYVGDITNKGGIR
ncbi:MAG TPA: extracellular solute-binding protein [Xanthobacteraceae bacterium]|jgi:ABC-type Fe3+ transport system substrate-binding protein|nr:extracellular solute-binding protein [Xanthobacteraceae bacterium]